MENQQTSFSADVEGALLSAVSYFLSNTSYLQAN